MTEILTGIKNFLELINENWTLILVIMGLIIMLAKKIKSYLQLSEQEKINIAMEQIQSTILKLISDAEEDYNSWVKAGAIKRAQVIKKIFDDYPILAKVTDQETLIAAIDTMIDDALVTLRKVLEKTEVGGNNG